MIDWLSVSFVYENIKDLYYFGESINDKKYGFYNFEKSYYTNKFTLVNYNFIKNKKVNLQFSGKSLLFYNFNDLYEYLNKKFDNIKCNRIDIAKDDFQNILSIDKIYNKLNNKEYISRLKSIYFFNSNNDISSIISKKISKNKYLVGKTIYLGDIKNGNVIIRFYDKLSEFIYRNKIVPENINHWIRVEIQLRNENSNSYFKKYYQIKPESLIYYYLRFVEPKYKIKNDKIYRISNKNCEISEFWKNFLNTEEKTSLNIYRLLNSPESKKKFFIEKISGLYMFLKNYYSNFDNEIEVMGKKLLEKNPYYIKLLNDIHENK